MLNAPFNGRNAYQRVKVERFQFSISSVKIQFWKYCES